MKSLNPRAKAALDQYRNEHALPADARDRARRALALRIAAGDTGLPGVTDVEAPRPPRAGAARLLRWSVAGSIGGFALLGGLLVGSSWLQPGTKTGIAAPAPAALPAALLPQQAEGAREQPLVMHPAPTDTTRAAALPTASERSFAPRTRRRAGPQAARTLARVPALVPGDVSQPAVQAHEPETQAGPEPTTTTGGAPRSTSYVPLPQTASSTPLPEPERSLDAEVALLRQAHEQLRLGQPLRALRALSEHAERFPRGELLEMRKATRVLALCALDRVEAARTEAERFLQQHASSGYVAKVRQLCAPAGSEAPLSTQSR
jgi:hypothetical protein